MLVISGGQSGADLAGNEWARTKNIPTVICSYEGFKPYKLEDLSLYNSFKQESYPEANQLNNAVDKLRKRTYLNVKRANFTLIFVQRPIDECHGSRLTARYCRELNREYQVINVLDFPDVLKQRLTINFRNFFQVLNIAGERYVDRPTVVKLLNELFI